MESENKLIDIFVSTLIEIGYPEDSILLDWKISANYRIDMAIIDNVSKHPIALFEFRMQNFKESENAMVEKLKRYSTTLGDTTIPLYVVFSANNTKGFEVYLIKDENTKNLLEFIPNIPQFKSLKNNYLTKAAKKNEEDIKENFNWFKYGCFISAFILAILLYYDFKGCISITKERLGIIVIIILLFVIPFARKLKILGLEFEVLQDNIKKKQTSN